MTRKSMGKFKELCHRNLESQANASIKAGKEKTE